MRDGLTRSNDASGAPTTQGRAVELEPTVAELLGISSGLSRTSMDLHPAHNPQPQVAVGASQLRVTDVTHRSM